MMTKELISIIVPVFNVEKFLTACVESLLQQTYEKIEIILVDDGSGDGCPSICDEYAKHEPRVVVFHKKNGGLSDARNYGLMRSRGQYVTFVDSDDFVRSDFNENLIQCEADISICDYKSVEENARIVDYIEVKNTNYNKKRKIIYSNEESLKFTYAPREHGMEFICCGKLYRKELFLNNNIQFPIGRLHEDIFTTYKLLYYSDKVVWSEHIGYYYRKRSGSIMNESFNIKRLDMVEATKEASEFFLEKGEKELADFAINFHVKTCFRMCNALYREKSIEKKIATKFYHEIKSDLKIKISESTLPIIKKFFYNLALNDPTKILMKKFM